MAERWTEINGYEGNYLISDQGNVFSRISDRMLNPTIAKVGYPMVFLTVGGKCKAHYVHRLVAMHFIPQMAGKEQVNHINGDKQDCRVENLEWVTHKENAIHAARTGLLDSVNAGKTKAVRAICMDTNAVQVFSSLAEAARTLGLRAGDISNVVCGRQKYTKGYKFELMRGDEYGN